LNIKIIDKRLLIWWLTIN